jgi:DNA-binding MarR family transcriptional regulator
VETERDLTNDVLLASRALLGVVARSVEAALEDVSLPQFRVLVLLSGRGPLRVGDLAALTSVHPSTFTRTADRLVKGNWVQRIDNPESRREVLIALTEAGQQLVDAVTQRRREELDRIMAGLGQSDQMKVADGMRLFAQAAGEPGVKTLLVMGL